MRGRAAWEQLRAEGRSAEDACQLAVADGVSLMERIRMLRLVYGLELRKAKCVAAQMTEADAATIEADLARQLEE